MSKTTKIMELLGLYEAILHHGNPKEPIWLYYKSVERDADGWTHNHRKLIGKYTNLGAVMADLMDSMNNATFWNGNWKA